MNIKKITQLLMGLFVYALGIVLTLQANMGVTPWNTFHLGVSMKTGMTIGTTISVTGLVIIIFNIFAKEKIGVGTILNMWLIGVFVDLLLNINVIPKATTLMGGLVLIFSGMIVIAVASWLYIGAGLGAGPRDGLMVAFMKWTGKPVGIVRPSIEITVLLIGILLGGEIGIGTPLIALTLGPICQIVFKIVGFDVKGIQHKYIEFKKAA